MRSRHLIPFLAAALLFLNCAGQAPAPQQDPAAVMLKSFYKSYLYNFLHADSKLAPLKKKYCTEKMIRKTYGKDGDEALDHDLFLHAQDAFDDWAQTLIVTKDLKKQNVYVVSYMDNDYAKKRTYIHLVVIKQGNEYKIDDVLE